MTRILSQQGNVIAADFRPSTSTSITVTLETETLYADDKIALVRTTGSIDGKPVLMTHILGDLATGHIVQL